MLNARTFLGSILALSVMVAIVSTVNLTQRPVLGVPLARAPHSRPVPAGKVEADRPPTSPLCMSTAILDYVPGAHGLATPIAAVRSYRPDAGELRIQSRQGGRAIVEELRGGTRFARYEVFRVKARGWLVEQADTYTRCDAGL